MRSKTEEISRQLTFPDIHFTKVLLGERDKNLKFVEKLEDVKINFRGNVCTISGDNIAVEIADRLLTQLYGLIEKGYPLYTSDIDCAHRILKENSSARLDDIFLDTVFISSKKKTIAPKSIAQKLYIDVMRKYDMVTGIGPAGTGKTYLAMAMAVSFLLEKKVNRIVLARPAVEAGEKLGFLPGDIAEKVNPYLRPLYDALFDMMDLERANSLVSRGIIEVAPLAFMRGRTLNDSFVILSEQMKMFLTRMGFGSKAVITGDITQIDLPADKTSGLVEIEGILGKAEGIKFVYFSEIGVVRHPLVQEIIKAYNHLDRSRAKRKPESGRQ